MCGICGVLHPDGSPVHREDLTAMREGLTHRGPDDSGLYLEAGVGLGHRRLAIIDLDPRSKGPIANEDGSVIATFNGEIYNFPELRSELSTKGHRFSSGGDSEVLVHLWEEEGPDMARRLRGMFAFALWDSRSRRLYLCRDRIGQKPLYLHRSAERIAFASELPALLRLPGMPRQVDPVAIHHYLALQYVSTPRTAWKEIEAVPPATWMCYQEGRWTTRRYWSPDFRTKLRLGGEDEYVEAFRETFLEAVRIRLISDVPLGLFLSGGIDSSLVVAATARVAEGRVRTFTIGFEEEAWDERPWARLVAERYGTDHTEEVVRPDAAGELGPLVRRYGQPFADPSAIPTWHVSRAARRHVKVVLNGDGGDEGFAGYQRYLAEKIARLWQWIPGPVRRGLIGPAVEALPHRDAPGSFVRRLRRFVLSANRDETYLQWLVFFDAERRRRLYRPEFAALVADEEVSPVQRLLREAPADHWLDRILFTDLRSYLPDDLMVKVDIASMSVGLEARSPFLDHRVMELAASLPPRWKLRGSSGKYLLKRAARDWLPEEILGRRKMGFGVPLERWLRTSLREEAGDLLLGGNRWSRHWFREEAVERLWREHQSREADHSYRLWALLVLESWLREFRPSLP